MKLGRVRLDLMPRLAEDWQYQSFFPPNTIVHRVGALDMTDSGKNLGIQLALIYLFQNFRHNFRFVSLCT